MVKTYSLNTINLREVSIFSIKENYFIRIKGEAVFSDTEENNLTKEFVKDYQWSEINNTVKLPIETIMQYCLQLANTLV